jgi:hypothetical protein
MDSRAAYLVDASADMAAPNCCNQEADALDSDKMRSEAPEQSCLLTPSSCNPLATQVAMQTAQFIAL